jgi:prepilin-type N-terminal cleavage/methylation domain-containing protein
MKFKLNNKGFSIIEIMIVVVIIAVLATTTIVVINAPERQRESRDIVRVSNMSQIATALELYFVDAKKYPQDLSELSVYNSNLVLEDASGCSYNYEQQSEGNGYVLSGLRESMNLAIPQGQSIEISEESPTNPGCDIDFKGSFILSK